MTREALINVVISNELIYPLPLMRRVYYKSCALTHRVLGDRLYEEIAASLEAHYDTR